MDDEREITFSEWRQRKFNPHAAPIVAGSRMMGGFGRPLDRGFHLGARLGQPIRSPHNFQVERHVATFKPRRRIQQLHLNSADAHRQLHRRGDLRRKRTRAQIPDYLSMLLLNPLAQSIGTESG